MPEAAIRCNVAEDVCLSMVRIFQSSEWLPPNLFSIVARWQQFAVAKLLVEQYGSTTLFDDESHTNLHTLLQCSGADCDDLLLIVHGYVSDKKGASSIGVDTSPRYALH